MSKVLSLRVSDELAGWADEYAKARGVSRQDLLSTALESFQADCAAGVPELRQIARNQSSVRDDENRGVGQCPERPEGFGHVWESWRVHPNKPCKFCGTPGRAPHDRSKPAGEQEGYYAQETARRAELYRHLKAPPSVRGIKPKEKP